MQDISVLTDVTNDCYQVFLSLLINTKPKRNYLNHQELFFHIQKILSSSAARAGAL